LNNPFTQGAACPHLSAAQIQVGPNQEGEMTMNDASIYGSEDNLNRWYTQHERERNQTMPTKPTHTPTPWSYEARTNRVVITGDSPEHMIVAEIDGSRSLDNAAHIVRCVNEREGLLAELRFVQKELEESRGNVTGLWARVKEIDRRIEAVLAHAERGCE
jgi:hypothetical protein